MVVKGIFFPLHKQVLDYRVFITEMCNWRGSLWLLTLKVFISRLVFSFSSFETSTSKSNTYKDFASKGFSIPQK